MDELEQIIERLRQRTKAGRIGFASQYVRPVEKCLAGLKVEYQRGLLFGDDQEWQKAVKSSDARLAYHDFDDGPATDLTFKAGDDASDANSKSLMGIECILTSNRKDRDGDILEPQGARIDKKMPLLWQHIPMQPIGKFVREVERADTFIKIAASIADTMLGRDAATLVEFGALRISHGFKPNKWEPIEEDSYGWHILDFDVMEVSLVSVPANVDAEITAFSRQKLHHPVVKAFAESKYRERAPLCKSGWDVPPVINVTVINSEKTMEKTPEQLAAEKAAKEAADKVAADAKTKADKEAADKEAKDKAEKESKAKKAKAKKRLKLAIVGARKPNRKGRRANGKKGTGGVAEGDEVEDEDEEDKDVEDEEEAEEDDVEEPEIKLSDLSEHIANASGVDGLPNEVKSRLSVLSGMMDDVKGYCKDASDNFGMCAESLDLVGCVKHASNLAETVHDSVKRMGKEVENIQSIKNLPEGVGEHLENAAGCLKELDEGLTLVRGMDPDSDTLADQGKDHAEDHDEDGKAAILAQVAATGRMTPKQKRQLKRLLAV